MKITIRPETEEDYKDITRIHDLVFNRGREWVLVEKLRKTACFFSELSLVAEYENRIVDHAHAFVGECTSCLPVLVSPVSKVDCFHRAVQDFWTV